MCFFIVIALESAETQDQTINFYFFTQLKISSTTSLFTLSTAITTTHLFANHMNDDSRDLVIKFDSSFGLLILFQDNTEMHYVNMNKNGIKVGCLVYLFKLLFVVFLSNEVVGFPQIIPTVCLLEIISKITVLTPRSWQTQGNGSGQFSCRRIMLADCSKMRQVCLFVCLFACFFFYVFFF